MLAAVGTVLLLGSCTSESGHAPPDSPFTRKNTVITATCEMGARFAAIAVRAWRPGTWERLAERYFSIPQNAEFSNASDAGPVHSPLVDLCDVGRNNESPYQLNDMESKAPRIRSLFDQGFTRMAVVYRLPGKNRTLAGSVDSEDVASPTDPWGGEASDEQNAVMSPDGRRVWFTYSKASGEARIGSRSIGGDKQIKDEGPATGHELPLSLTGHPSRALQANTVRLSPDGRRFAATAPGVYGTVFDALTTSSALTRKTARNATLVGDCTSVVGWVSDQRVLCRSGSGVFRVREAASGQTVGEAINVVRPDDGTIAEGVLMSADRTSFVAFVHYPYLPHGMASDTAVEASEFRVVSTTSQQIRPIPTDLIRAADTVFLDWL
ncbi:hypothetical protein ACIBH1_03635 [Nonomuraea sp. NPDC050663]|uniref:hypothetical protein n=1 Tax=Nonomuraea sp. NPDC050663 TaxID=3364370 RepID=UPI0037AB4587